MKTDRLELALQICRVAHAGQTDKAGAPYHLHPEYVASLVDTEDEKIVALLHDVMEDTPYPPRQLREQFGEQIFTALELLTHRAGEPYFDYVRRIRQNNLARKVKLADLQHNSMIERIPNPTRWDYQRIEKYKRAIQILKEESL